MVLQNFLAIIIFMSIGHCAFSCVSLTCWKRCRSSCTACMWKVSYQCGCACASSTSLSLRTLSCKLHMGIMSNLHDHLRFPLCVHFHVFPSFWCSETSENRTCKKMFSLSHDLRGKSDKFVTGWEFGPNVKLSQRKTDDFGCGSVCRRWVSRWDGNCEVISMHYFNRQTAWTFKISPTIFRISKGLRYSSLLSFTYFNLKKI